MAGLDVMRSDSDPSEMMADVARPGSAAKGISGKLVVVGMFAFGLLLTGVLYTYWDLHTGPFRPLQEAIARSIPESSPRVIGGRYKSHLKDSPKTLRIIIRVDYNPLDESNEARRDELARAILRLVRTHHDVSTYELIELHLEHRVPERPNIAWSSKRTPEEWDEFSAKQNQRPL
jgi:hypothetical protein